MSIISNDTVKKQMVIFFRNLAQGDNRTFNSRQIKGLNACVSENLITVSGQSLAVLAAVSVGLGLCKTNLKIGGRLS